MMKSKNARNRRIPLNCKYRWRGMAKTNYRKHGGRVKFAGENEYV